MKTTFALTIAITGSKAPDLKTTHPNPGVVIEFDDFKLDLKHEIDMEPQEYTEACQSLGKLLTTLANDIRPNTTQHRCPACSAEFEDGPRGTKVVSE